MVSADRSNTPPIYDAVVIGGGPAGSQCGLWMTKLGLNCCILEGDTLGGLQSKSPYTNSWLSVVQATTAAKSVAGNISSNLKAQDCKVITENAQAVLPAHQGNGFLVRSNNHDLAAKHLVIATGTTEKTGGINTQAGNFALGLVGAFHADYRQKRVAILGGGDAACETFATASTGGADQCMVFARNIRARSNIWAALPKGQTHVGGYKVGEHHIHYGDGKTFQFDLAVVCYGWQPVVPNLFRQPRKNQLGYLKVSRSLEISIPQIFAIGDVNERPYPCVTTALADGVYAAKEIEKRIMSGD